MTPTRTHRRPARAGRWLAAALLPIGALLLVPGAGEAQAIASGETVRALFPVCRGSQRVTCVVDGDTIWLRGTKIRIADIDTPEVSQPACPRERALGLRATERMRELLNAGAFRVEAPADGRTRDRFGRELRIITRGGQSLGAVLVREGLAARWGGPRREWC
jgi:endonuclease YncB( thermonuclease family)